MCPERPNRHHCNLVMECDMNMIRYEAAPTVRDVFDEFFRGFAMPYRGRETGVPMRVEVREENGAYKVRADLPGVKKEDIGITVEGDVVSIKAEVRREAADAEKDRVLYTERHQGRFERSFRLADEIAEDKVEAKYVDGVLELVLPRKAATVARQITVH